MASPSDEIRSATARIRVVLSDYPSGSASQTAMAEITKEARYIEDRMTGQREKLSSLLEWAAILYSSRKWERYGGAEKVASFIRSDCASIDSIAKRMRVAALEGE